MTVKREHSERYTADELRETRDRSEDLTDWARVDGLTEGELGASIDPSEESAFDWSTTQVGMPGSKRQLTVRFDQDVIDWFKAQGSRDQTRMNAVRRAYVQAQEGVKPKPCARRLAGDI